jgi:hypothetical protein
MLSIPRPTAGMHLGAQHSIYRTYIHILDPVYVWPLRKQHFLFLAGNPMNHLAAHHLFSDEPREVSGDFLVRERLQRTKYA